MSIEQAAAKRTRVEHGLELVNQVNGPRLSVDALHIETEQVDGLDALIDHHGYRQPVSLIQPIQRNPKHRLDGSIGWEARCDSGGECFPSAECGAALLRDPLD